MNGGEATPAKSAFDWHSVQLLRTSTGVQVGAKATYDGTTHQVVLRPLSRLAASTSYSVVVSTKVKDLAGTRLDQQPHRAGRQPATWTFRTQ